MKSPRLVRIGRSSGTSSFGGEWLRAMRPGENTGVETTRLASATLKRAEMGSPRSGAFVDIASVAGFSWQRRLAQLQEFRATPDIYAGVCWYDAHPMDGNDAYDFSKEAVVVFSMWLAGLALHARPLVGAGKNPYSGCAEVARPGRPRAMR